MFSRMITHILEMSSPLMNRQMVGPKIYRMIRVCSLDEVQTLVCFAEMYEFVAFSAILPGLLYGLEEPEMVFQNCISKFKIAFLTICQILPLKENMGKKRTKNEITKSLPPALVKFDVTSVLRVILAGHGGNPLT